MADALKSAYEDVFHIREIPTQSDRPAVEGLFKSKHNSTDKVAQLQAMTFYALLSLADMKSADAPPSASLPESALREEPLQSEQETPRASTSNVSAELHYTIQIHLPATKDIEVFNAIFRSLRENLLT